MNALSADANGTDALGSHALGVDANGEALPALKVSVLTPKENVGL